MRILAIDVGSSSIKAGYYKNGKLKSLRHVPVQSHLAGHAAEIPAGNLLASFEEAIRQTTAGRRKLDAIGIDTFSPGLVALDKNNRPLLGCITHQDRRSLRQAGQLEKTIGMQRHLELTGNRPFPGGIASTSLLWVRQNQPELFRRIHRIGQPTTLLVHHLSGQWVIDPSQAAFLGLYDGVKLGGWVAEICAAVGVEAKQLPQIKFADEVAGRVTRAAADRLGLPEGCPVLASLVDTSAAMLATPGHPGQLVHSAGSTDVLALCLPRAKPAPDILTRPLGPGASLPRRWLAVSTIAAGGSTMHWVRANLFADYSAGKFNKLVEQIGEEPAAVPGDDKDNSSASPPVFQPYLAGDRTSLEVKTAAFENLTLAATRFDMLRAVVESLAQASRERFNRLRRLHPVRREIFTMGGQAELARIMHRRWPGRWTFTPLEDEALGGLCRLAAVVERL